MMDYDDDDHDHDYNIRYAELCIYKYEGCEGYGSANGLSQPIMELAEEAMNIPIWAVIVLGIAAGAKLF